MILNCELLGSRTKILHRLIEMSLYNAQLTFEAHVTMLDMDDDIAAWVSNTNGGFDLLNISI